MSVSALAPAVRPELVRHRARAASGSAADDEDRVVAGDRADDLSGRRARSMATASVWAWPGSVLSTIMCPTTSWFRRCSAIARGQAVSASAAVAVGRPCRPTDRRRRPSA